MVKSKRPRKKTDIKRFSVSLDEQDYKDLKALADNNKPYLSLQYVVQYAIQLFLERSKDSTFRAHLGNPLGARKQDD